MRTLTHLPRRSSPFAWKPRTRWAPASPRLRLAGAALLALLLCGSVTGCRSLSGSGSGSFASVKIAQRSVEEIQAATIQVFREKGYGGGASGLVEMVFVKEASGLTTVSRDGLMAAQGGTRTLERVRVEVVDLGGGTHRLQCQVFMVTGAGDSFFEEEQRLTNFRSGPYRKLLDDVADKLK